MYHKLFMEYFGSLLLVSICSSFFLDHAFEANIRKEALLLYLFSLLKKTLTEPPIYHLASVDTIIGRPSNGALRKP